MSTGRICVRSVVIAAPEETVATAARRMRDHQVGTLFVLGAKDRPIGALTDRDVVVRCVAEARDPDKTLVSEVMTTPIATVREETPIETALERMAGVSARRLAVTDDEDRLIGVLSLDDVLDLLVEEAESIGRLLRRPGAQAGA
jgi:CBS domain-containing protein